MESGGVGNSTSVQETFSSIQSCCFKCDNLTCFECYSCVPLFNTNIKQGVAGIIPFAFVIFTKFFINGHD